MKRVDLLFPSQIYVANLERASLCNSLNKDLLEDCRKIREQDQEGKKWSKKNYFGGYTSYGSWSNLHERSSSFIELKKYLDRHVKEFSKSLQWDTKNHPLSMTNCWVNFMPSGAFHGLHIHPISAISGTYYLSIPKNSASIKFEDPRLSRMMAVPPKQNNLDQKNKNFFSYVPKPSQVILFESWIGHEVGASNNKSERISISFNYSWF